MQAKPPVSLTFFFFILFLQAVAQQPGLPKIIPAAPAAQTFMRYGEIPVDYSTGVPNIQIPIYTISGKKLTVPISISYHASGIKVNDIPSETGLGWALNAGGLVSRNVNGIRDEGKSSTRTYSTSQQILDALNAPAYYAYNGGAFTGITDMEYFLKSRFEYDQDYMSDRYFYKFPNGVTGIFKYNFLNFNDDENNVITLPYKPFKIKKIVDGTYPSENINRFEITDDEGTVYIFKSYTLGYDQTCSEWFLTEMASADRTEIITFNYALQSTGTSMPIYSHNYQDNAVLLLSPGSGCSPTLDINPIYSSTLTPSPIHSPVLESIVSSNTIVRFYYAAREDFSNLKRLTRITAAPIKSPENIIKSFDFVPRYFGSTTENKRLGLDKIIVNSLGNSEQQIHSFIYESSELPPYPFKMSAPRFNEDFWGYNNGSNSPSLLSADFMPDNGYKQSVGGNRDPDPTGYFSKACMLKEIQYPTGGRTVFEFERNNSGYVYTYKANPSGYVGGFRVKSITNYLNNSTQVADMKTYEYTLDEAAKVDKALFSYQLRYNDSYACSQYTREILLSNPVLPLEVAPGLPIMYRQVVEYNGTAANNSGKAVYHYGPSYTPAGYQANNPDNYDFPLPRYCHPFHYDKGNYVPELINKEIYSFDGTTYHLLQREENTYSKLFTTEYNTGIKLTRPIEYRSIDYYGGIVCGDCSTVFMEHKSSINVKDTKAYQEASLLTNSKNYTFDPLDESKYVLSTTDYTYNPANLQIKEKSTVSSEQKTLKTTYKYPHDFSSQAPYNAMINKHIYTSLVEESNFVGSTLLQTIKTNYKDWGNNIIAPETVKTNRGGPEDLRINYKYNNKGNLVETSKAVGDFTSYIWGYNQTLPIAKIENAIYLSENGTESWSGSFSYLGMLSNYQNVTLNGTCLFPKAVNATITRQYYKSTDHQVAFTVYIYDSNHNVVTYFVDAMPVSQTAMTISSIIPLSAGQYSVEISPTYQSGSSYNHEINVSILGENDISSILPFHTSFEDETTGIVDSYSKTGRKSCLGSYNISLPGCAPSNNKYTLSYWTKQTVGSPWEFVKQNITVPSYSSTISIGSANQYLDEVRVYPENGLMNTYTYDTLSGITSETDAKDRTISYEYDSFQRLKTVRDNEGKILKSYNYHIKP